MLLRDDPLREYQAELIALRHEDDELEAQEAVITVRRDAIKARVKAIATAAVDEKTRVILPAGQYGAWDRIVSRRGAGLDVRRLEELLGEQVYRKLCCIRQVTYVPAPEKIEAARLAGKLSDLVMGAATTDGELGYSLKKMSVTQLRKHAEQEEE